MAAAATDSLASAQAILNNLLGELQAETAYRVANGPKPTYSVGGRSFDWNGYVKTMREEIKSWMEIVNMLDTTEIHVRGYPGM